jgi:NCAIR mutase (PurE)-related protein
MKKRGRKAGSGSFAQVSLEELNRVLKPNARVIVWGRYAQMLGLEGKKVEAKHETLVAAVSGGTADIELETFGNAKPENKKHEAHQEDLVPKPSVTLEVF